MSMASGCTPGGYTTDLLTEETNIIDRPDARATLQQMQAELRTLMEQTRYGTKP